jgi:hypothetical protein
MWNIRKCCHGNSARNHIKWCNPVVHCCMYFFCKKVPCTRIALYSSFCITNDFLKTYFLNICFIRYGTNAICRWIMWNGWNYIKLRPDLYIIWCKFTGNMCHLLIVQLFSVWHMPQTKYYKTEVVGIIWGWK